jgi:hypothetical protein
MIRSPIPDGMITALARSGENRDNWDRRELIFARAYDDLPRSARRRLVSRALLRPTLSAAVLFVLYFTLPLDRTFSGRTVALLALGLCVLAARVALQVRAIVRSPYPRLTAITALAFRSRSSS